MAGPKLCRSDRAFSASDEPPVAVGGVQRFALAVARKRDPPEPLPTVVTKWSLDPLAVAAEYASRRSGEFPNGKTSLICDDQGFASEAMIKPLFVVDGKARTLLVMERAARFVLAPRLLQARRATDQR